MNKLRFEANTPVQVALKYDGGSDVDGPYGHQVLYTLADDRLMYLEPKAARRIDELKVTAGEPFSICKRQGRNGQKRTVEWEVNRLEPSPTTARLDIVPPGGGNEPSASKPTLQAAKVEPGRKAQPTIRRTALAPALDKPEPAVWRWATTLETQLRASIPGTAKLEYALKTAIAAAAGRAVRTSDRLRGAVRARRYPRNGHDRLRGERETVCTGGVTGGTSAEV